MVVEAPERHLCRQAQHHSPTTAASTYRIQLNPTMATTLSPWSALALVLLPETKAMLARASGTWRRRLTRPTANAMWRAAVGFTIYAQMGSKSKENIELKTVETMVELYFMVGEPVVETCSICSAEIV